MFKKCICEYEEEQMNTSVKNNTNLGVLCGLLGGFAGIVIWIFLKLMSEGMWLIWEWIPDKINIPFYTVAVCTIGAVGIGLFRKKYGDYPEELNVVLGKVRNEKQYEYKKMFTMLLAALFPLLIGSSVGPEAGLTGIIVGLCYWVGDNIKSAHKDAKKYSEIGMAVTLGVLFHSPLFGIFAVEEQDDEDEIPQLTKTFKIFLYGISIAAATACYMLLSRLFGKGMEGFPSFEWTNDLEIKDYFMMSVYILAGCILAVFYEVTHKGCHKVAEKIPPILREAIAGLCLGLTGSVVPMILFSGEEQMGELMTEYVQYLPWMLIGVAFLKILITNICIQLGLKGGHFFPVIFAGVCLGYALAMLAFADSAAHVVFAAAIVTAALLGGTMRKPMAVTMLLFICFPVKIVIWIFVAALFGNKIVSFCLRKENKND